MTRSMIYLADFLVAIAAAALLYLGIRWMLAPRIYFIANPLLGYVGPALTVLAVLLAWFRQQASSLLVRLCTSLGYWLSGMLAAFMLGAEAFMHGLGIPHVEGWWIPLLSSGMAAAYGMHGRKKKQISTKDAENG